MTAFFRRLGWVVVLGVLLVAAIVFYVGITGGGMRGEVTAVRDRRVVNPAGDAPATVIPGVTVGPAGLAVPVAGVKPRELVDTFNQARAGGARVHDAIDIMAAEGTPVVAAASGTAVSL